ncbi:3'(2'),5'-bisphosphate nucleotidase CysQ [Actinorhabdospora filicis]|uniref:3'(2'),5'-bisphosphate nucleotidase CysQ n=2 Tax=Actinorhabdospora filicis TaxID=1785913 RepID=A0A9W6SIF3_9ACTN|nr:3'(2'),5'-bisphosphate nucleotidase CysQ [Actinorhabdospora filicis]
MSVQGVTLCRMSATDGVFARELAELAGRELLALRLAEGFGDPAKLRAEGDRRAHELIMAELAASRPGDAILSEEGEGEQGRTGTSRRSADRVWIVDPLDGTREFGEEGNTDWAVHIALWERGKGLTAGAVALPAKGYTLGTDVPPDAPGQVSAGPRIAVSRSRPPAWTEKLAEATGGSLVPMGSAGAKVAAVVTGTVDAYVHAGGQHEWDSAAPVAVAVTAGLHASRIDGAALEYNAEDPKLPDLLVCRPELAEVFLRELAGLL